MKKSIKLPKQMVFVIHYKVNPEDAATIGEVMDKMREYGDSEIVDVFTEEPKP